jgi:hypothetical protein
VPDRVVRQRRLAEVALREIPEVEPVPNRKRLVQPVVLLERGDSRRIAGGLLAEVRRNGVARHELGEHENDEGDSDRE